MSMFTEAEAKAILDKVIALSKADALAPDILKDQVARLKRAAKRAPIVLSAASGRGVPDALRALMAVIDEARSVEKSVATIPAPEAWRP